MYFIYFDKWHERKYCSLLVLSSTSSCVLCHSEFNNHSFTDRFRVEIDMAYYYFDDKSRLNSFLTFFFLLVLLFINPSSVLSKSPRPITVNPIFLLSLSLSFHYLLWCNYFLFWSSSSCFFILFYWDYRMLRSGKLRMSAMLI